MAERPKCKGKCGEPEHDGRHWPNDHIVWDIILELTRHYCCITCFLKHEFGPDQTVYADLYTRHKFIGDHGGRCNSRKKSTTANDTSGTGDDGARWDNGDGGGSFRSMSSWSTWKQPVGSPAAGSLTTWQATLIGGATGMVVVVLSMMIGILWNK